jgi:hypothetical protein
MEDASHSRLWITPGEVVSQYFSEAAEDDARGATTRSYRLAKRMFHSNTFMISFVVLVSTLELLLSLVGNH